MDERQSQMFMALRQITEEVAKKPDLEQAMETLVRRIREATLADCCSLYLYESLRDRFRLRATDGLSREAVGKVTLQSGEGLVGVVGKKRELLDLADAPSHPSFKYLPEVGEDEYMSFLGVPVLNQGDLLGVLVIQSKEQKQFGPTEESFLVTLAAQIASIIAISRADSIDDDPNIKRVHGVSGTGGMAIAKAMVWQPAISIEQVKVLRCEDPSLQQELFHQTLFQLQVEMDRAALKMEEAENRSAMFGYMSGYGRLLDDISFEEDVDRVIEEQRVLASSAIKLVIESRLDKAREDEDDDLYTDLHDFSEVLIARLVHASAREFELSESVILVVESLPAAMVAELPPDRIAGFVATSSATSSHASILARDLGIPSVQGVDIDLSTIDGHMLIVDGKNAEILIDPPQSVVDEFEELISQNRAQSDLFFKEIGLDPVTLDGRHVNVQLNAGLSSEKADDGLKEITDGIGLFRSEIAFMLTQTFPTQEQQVAWYSGLLKKFAPLPVCIRTLDIGSDKGLPYLPIREINPAFGWRGVRVTIDQPQILMTQLKAMLIAHQQYGNLEIMVPMVSRLDEVLFMKKALHQAALELSAKDGREYPIPRFGIMLEVPSVAFFLEDFVDEVDFLSIGSNDLIQYLLAVDRSNPKVSRFYDPFHPAVVRCLAHFAKVAKEHQRHISVCGELAGDPLGALLLISLGYENLSMNYSDIAKVKYVIRHVESAGLCELGAKALTEKDGQKLRALYEEYATVHGLSRVIALHESSRKAYSMDAESLQEIVCGAGGR